MYPFKNSVLLKYSNAENVKICLACARNDSQGKQVSQQYV